MTRIVTLIAVFLLLAQAVFGGGLYEQITTPISGEVVEYRRMPYAEISNPLNQPVTITMTTEQVKLYPDAATMAQFLRRITLSSTGFTGKLIPLLNPLTGEQISYLTTDQYYALTYSLWILAEKQADGLVRFSESSPQTIYYVTSGEVTP